MSADSPRRGLHKGAQVISPQPISDRSIIDSVAGIINDIVPQAYAGAPNSDNKESITWARFEYADVNNSAFYPDYIEGSATPPLLLVLGYTTGVQVWVVAASGEATEVLSWRQGIVRTLRILPDPKTDEDHGDPFEQKRPMVAICDSAGPGPQFCSVSFISLRTSEQTKSIKFKNPVCDVLANRRSVVVTFSEKIAVFDARTLEDVLTVTTCYLSPGPSPNPVALGTRWLAYSEKKLLPARRSSGGSEGEGVQSYTAAVLYAAKSLGKGLRGLGETVASSLTGNSVTPMAMNNVGGDVTQPGVVTILDLQAAKEEKELDDPTIETVVAHFTAHNDAIVAMTFDLTGALLMTADKRGHDFHVFRIQPHPGGPTLAAVHHLYVLHRGDTTAKVQDMTFSSDTRWAAVSTVRGTTHVFPVAPYGGPVGVRTHSTPHVVNRLSRFHRSAGLTDDGTRSHSPVSHAELPVSVYPYSNPRLPPYPHPTILHPLAQIRQPSTLNHSNSQAQPSRPQQRQRLHSDDSGSLPLKICACFAPPRAWIYAQRDSTSKVAKRAVDSLFIMACHGNMIQYDLEPKPAAGVPKEKVCDDTTIELEVEAKGQWPLLRTPNSLEIVPPLTSSSPLLCTLGSPKSSRQLDTADDRWLSQVEIVTHAGPHRRLWMGPQFVFKTYNAPSGVNLIESEAIEIGVTGGSRPARSNPVNMPHAAARPLVPVVIDGSGSSYEQSPRFMEAYGDSLDNDTIGIGNGENQLREDLAEAMLETSTAPHRVPGRRLVVERVGQPVTKVVNPLGTVITVLADEEDISSSQEFDDATPEPPRSVCAEEGPASLGDFDTTEGQDLRNLTEICAEMRSASEPAIDSVPDESIRDVKERKTLCVEAATMRTGRNSIDFERAEAFRDVPTSLSLCVEQGEIPSSPMTQARENTWSKRTAKREDSELQERTFAKAKYVVSYDEDSVVLMEKKSSGKSLQEHPGRRVGYDEENVVMMEKKSSGKSLQEHPGRRVGYDEDSVVMMEKKSSGKSLQEHPGRRVGYDEDSVVMMEKKSSGKSVQEHPGRHVVGYEEDGVVLMEKKSSGKSLQEHPGRHVVGYDEENVVMMEKKSSGKSLQEHPGRHVVGYEEENVVMMEKKSSGKSLQEHPGRHVVGHDEENVVMMEKKSSGKSKLQEHPGQSVKEIQPEASSRKSETEPERATKRPGKLSSSARATKRSTCGAREQPKYLVHEHEDSIVIEDTTVPEKVESKKIETSRKSSRVGEGEIEDAEDVSTKSSPDVEVEVETATRRGRGKDRRNSKSQRTAEPSLETEAMIVEKLEPAESFVDLKDVVGANVEDETLVTMRNEPEPMEATTATGSASLPTGAPPLDDMICMDYHIVEATYPVVEPVYSQQSDDDIEHIHSSEVTQMLEIVQTEKSVRDELEVSPIRQRKSSKGTISDDDLEHINSSELAEVVERGTALLSAVKSFALERNDNDDFHRVRSSSKGSVLAFDDDLEHVYHSEITELQATTSTSPAVDSTSPRAAPKKSQDSQERTTSLRTRGSRKRKDVVVIDSDTSEAEVTVIVKSIESWSKSKTPEKDLAEEIDRCAEPKEHPSDQTTSQSLPKKTRVRTAKSIVNPTASQKRQPGSDMIEIIDIDAMQKAEMEVASECGLAAPECKILETRHDTPTTRSQKSRRNKKAHIDSAISVEAPSAPMEALSSEKLPQESGSSVSWSSVVRKPDGEPEVPANLPEEARVVRQVEEKIVPEVGEDVVQVDCEETKVSECRVSKTSELPEKIVGSKKRGKKTRIAGSGADGSTGSPVKTIAVELPSTVQSSSSTETARRGSRGRGKSTVVAVLEDVERDDDVEVEVDVKMIDETLSGWKYDAESATSAPLESSTASKENSPEPEVQVVDVEVEVDKRVESDQEVVPERSSSSDDLNANVVPMDTEEDSAVREIAEKNGSSGASPSWSSVNKKNTRSKKKKRR